MNRKRNENYLKRNKSDFFVRECERSAEGSEEKMKNVSTIKIHCCLLYLEGT